MHKISIWLKKSDWLKKKKKKRGQIRLPGSLVLHRGKVCTSGRWLICWVGKHHELSSRICWAAGSTQTSLQIISAIKEWKSGEERAVTLQQPHLIFFRTQGDICFGKFQACSTMAWRSLWYTGECDGLWFPQLQPTVPELLRQLPSFLGCQYVKNGDVNTWVYLSGSTILAPGKNKSPIASNILTQFLYHDKENQPDPGFGDVAGAPEPHTTNAH